MNINEAIQVLEETKVMTLIAIDTNYTANEGHRTQWKKEVEAISTILQELDKLQKENEEYSKQMDLDYVDENFVSKDKIREKIELIKTLRVAFYNEANVISILEELLKEE